ncbi:MAG TPA: hypothetical protein VMJ32_18205 [Pirellulales bacterium]|nr:hypothetical protein [Pirellulales bacterium]
MVRSTMRGAGQPPHEPAGWACDGPGCEGAGACEDAAPGDDGAPGDEGAIDEAGAVAAADGTVALLGAAIELEALPDPGGS